MPEPAFLIDECLSPDLAEAARGRGFHALHVNWANLRRKSDRHVALYALDRNLILVTNNTVDFENIYRAKEIHPGLIFIECEADRVLTREMQVRLFELAMDEIIDDEPVNEALLVELFIGEVGQAEVSITRYPLPK